MTALRIAHPECPKLKRRRDGVQSRAGGEAMVEEAGGQRYIANLQYQVSYIHFLRSNSNVN
jgi:hypothetical protein